MDLHTWGALIHGEKFVLSLGWTYTEGCTYSWREVCVRFRMDLHIEGVTYSWRDVCVRFRMDLHGGVHLFMEGSLLYVRFRMDLHAQGHLFMEGRLC